ncbi:hypothetical protein DSCO28_53970 [Desulfosarcina ovata subsp. sediminis]|uniref:Uncharacterized protein n=1 Tax=Desulfosarcina ovata subsp. sediminis TaxID=885957 RepID=A0A5K7ZXI4_9BACT|nr:hypothetical protein [Desulfosarcina ovata]BBO84831.1 hypothetical protein DSCO28_53970 [Desulfosarcina ovata subsp. sediminis]
MSEKMWPLWVPFLLLVIALSPGKGIAGIPEVNHVMVTDVTTVSFSVIWASSEAATADIEVFEDANGTTLLSGAVVVSHPVNDADKADAIKAAAEESGVMKVMVTGLQPDTTYYFQTITTSKSTADVTSEPAAAPLTSVTTETSTVRTYEDGTDILPFSNDVIVEDCYLEDGTTPADGSLLIATVAGGQYPITAFIGDGVDSPYALIDLNNMFSRESSENLDLEQGENLTLVNFGGLNGNSVVSHRVPSDLGLAEIKSGDPFLKVGWNMVSLPLEPINNNIVDLIESIYDKVDSIWAYDASSGDYLSMDKSMPDFLWSLRSLESTTGYWFVMNEETSFKYNGDFQSNTMQLSSGWNLVGVKDLKTKDLSESIADISEYVESIWYYDAAEGIYVSYDVTLPSYLNSLFTIEPGNAYWFVMSSECDDGNCEW